MAFSESVAARGLESRWDRDILVAASGDRFVAALIKGTISQESAWRQDAINPGDPSYGLMQIMLPTAQGIQPGVTLDQLMDPSTNIAIGSAFLDYQLRRYDGDHARAASAYNAGTATLRNQGYVDAVLAYRDWFLANDPLLNPSVEPDATTMYATTTEIEEESSGLALAGFGEIAALLGIGLLVAGMKGWRS